MAKKVKIEAEKAWEKFEKTGTIEDFLDFVETQETSDKKSNQD